MIWLCLVYTLLVEGFLFKSQPVQGLVQGLSCVCGCLQAFGIALDQGKNRTFTGGKTGEIQSTESDKKVLVIPTDEELSIALQTVEVIGQQ